jgi:outer membrane protein TolC
MRRNIFLNEATSSTLKPASSLLYTSINISGIWPATIFPCRVRTSRLTRLSTAFDVRISKPLRAVPLALPSQLLERRYDVVSAERAAASANAKIGVAEAAFFPNLTLSAQGGFQHNALANLFSVPNRFWTLGPELAGTIFDGGARTAAVREARATYDEFVAAYRGTVLAAFQSVEDSLSSWNHLRQQEQAYADIYERNKQLFESERAQFHVGRASEQSLFSEQLTLLLAQQNLEDTQALLTLSSVTLIKNLGGGWEWDDAKEVPVDVASSSAGSR